MNQWASGKSRFRANYISNGEDFMENPTNKFYRLSPGREVRLRYSYLLNVPGLSKTIRERSLNFSVPMTLKQKGAMRLTGERLRQHFTGWQLHRQLKPKCGCTTGYLQILIRRPQG